jgi:enoyl-CoA hydratase/carnithine racemase
MTQHLHSGLDAGVLTLTLARPDKRNAITDAMYGALADGLERAEADTDIRAVLIRGEGGHFSAGNDLADFARYAADPAGIEEAEVFRFLRALARTETPLVAAVKGQAVGVGLTLLLHCDLVFLAEDARLSAPFSGLGLTPENASSLLLPARIGHPRAFALFALGESLDGRTAAEWGIANAALPADEVEPRAQAAARALAERPPEALRATKRLMRRAETLYETLDRENRVFAERLASAEARAAFRDFFQRR